MQQATTQFQMRIEPEIKKILSTLAKREGRSKSNMVKRLILERYEAVKVADPKPAQEQEPAAVA